MNLVMQWPQITWLVLAFLALIVHMISEGEPLKGKYSPASKLIAILVMAVILYFGGFFTEVRP